MTSTFLLIDGMINTQCRSGAGVDLKGKKTAGNKKATGCLPLQLK